MMGIASPRWCSSNRLRQSPGSVPDPVVWTSTGLVGCVVEQCGDGQVLTRYGIGFEDRECVEKVESEEVSGYRCEGRGCFLGCGFLHNAVEDRDPRGLPAAPTGVVHHQVTDPHPFLGETLREPTPVVACSGGRAVRRWCRSS